MVETNGCLYAYEVIMRIWLETKVFGENQTTARFFAIMSLSNASAYQNDILWVSLIPTVEAGRFDSLRQWLNRALFVFGRQRIESSLQSIPCSTEWQFRGEGRLSASCVVVRGYGCIARLNKLETGLVSKLKILARWLCKRPRNSDYQEWP